MSRTIALLPYPASAALRGRLEAKLGETPEYVSLAQLGRLRSFETVRSLRRYSGGRAVVAIENEASRSAVPVLHAVAVAAGTSPVDLFDPDGRLRRLGRLELLTGATGSVAATIVWMVVGRRRTLHDLRRLNAQPIQVARTAPQRRVLYLNSNLWFGLAAGGSVAHVAGVVNGFAHRGFEVDLFAPGNAPMIGADVRTHSFSAPTPLALLQEANVQRFQRLVLRDIARYGRPQYAFLYQRNSIGSYAGAVAARRFKTPFVLEYNGSEVWTAKRWGSGLRYEEEALLAEEASLRHAAIVVTVSDVLRDELLERGIPAERIVMYPNGVDPDLYRPTLLDADERDRLRGHLEIPADALVVGFIGTFGQWHGVDVLARAIVQLVEEDTARVESLRLRFLLVGDGLKMPEVEAALSGSRAEPYVTLAGLVPQEEGGRYLAAADILVSPHVPNPDGTRFFGSPTKLFEYMATGRAIIASSLEQIGEILSPALRTGALPDGSPGTGARELAVLTTPGDVDDLVTAMRWLAARPEWRNRLAQNARARVLERHTWDHHVDAILERVGVADKS